MQVKTTPEDMKRIEEARRLLHDLILNLYSRWLDEQAYENIDDYAEPIKKLLPAGFVLVKMSKQPFGFKFTIGTEAEYMIYANSSAYCCKRTK